MNVADVRCPREWWQDICKWIYYMSLHGKQRSKKLKQEEKKKSLRFECVGDTDVQHVSTTRDVARGAIHTVSGERSPVMMTESTKVLEQPGTQTVTLISSDKSHLFVRFFI